MSPLRYHENNEFGYNIADPGEVRLAYSCGSALYAVRSELTNLHASSDEPRDVGYQFMSAFGKFSHDLCHESSKVRAAARLRRELIGELTVMKFDKNARGKAERGLRDRLVNALSATQKPPHRDPFQALFNYVIRSARNLYGDSWPESVQCRCQVIGDQSFPGTRFWINAYTVLDTDNVTTPPSVRLNINPYQLNVETYSAIYAILVHECFCHAPAHRTEQRNESPFAEGFCDWAASELFDRWLHELDPSLEDAAREFGKAIWLEMMKRDGGNKYWKARLAGHKAASHVVRVFMDDGATDQEAIGQVIELARQLVVAKADLALKDTFVLNLGPQPVEKELRHRLTAWRSGQADVMSVLSADLI